MATIGAAMVTSQMILQWKSSRYGGARSPSIDCGSEDTPMNRLVSTYHVTAEPARLFARLPTVMQATGLGRSTIYRLVACGAFPRPVHLGPRAVAWRWSDLDEWSATRATDRH
jgi:prophage regulatory protein